MFKLWILLQTQQPLDDGVIDTAVNQINQLGGIDGATQLAAIISLLIGAFIVILVMEVRNWNRGQQLRNMYLDEIKQLQGQLDDKDSTISTRDKMIDVLREKHNEIVDELRGEKRTLEDAIALANRTVADKNQEIANMQATIELLNQKRGND